MMPLRAAIPKTVRKPTSEPSESTPPPTYAASTPPTRADGKVKKDRAASRVVPKRELDLPEVPFEVADYGTEVASPHVGINVNATRSVFTFYLVRGWYDAYVGHIP